MNTGDKVKAGKLMALADVRAELKSEIDKAGLAKIGLEVAQKIICRMEMEIGND